MKDEVFIKDTYIPAIYKRHSIAPVGMNTLKPIGNNIFDELKDENYFLNLMRIEKNTKKYLDVCKY